VSSLLLLRRSNTVGMCSLRMHASMTVWCGSNWCMLNPREPRASAVRPRPRRSNCPSRASTAPARPAHLRSGRTLSISAWFHFPFLVTMAFKSLQNS
jgi:hypothetical protein